MGHLDLVLLIGTMQLGPPRLSWKESKVSTTVCSLDQTYYVAASATMRAAKCSASSSVCTFNIMHIIMFDK